MEQGSAYIRVMFRILATALCLFFAPPPQAFIAQAFAAEAELVMFEQPGCPFCAKWNREIGPIYPKSDIGAKAPLRRVQIGDKQTYGVSLNSPVIFTPTFVISVGGRETGRIEGYANDESFWGLISQRTAEIAAPAAQAPAAQVPAAQVPAAPQPTPPEPTPVTPAQPEQN